MPALGGVYVKSIGDAVMLMIGEPALAIHAGLRITHDLTRGHRAPLVRVGMHHGPAIKRTDDFFGATVNLAARVSAEASAGEVLLTGQTASRVGELAGVLLEPRGRRKLRNVRDPVDLVAAVVPAGRRTEGCHATPCAAWPSIPSAPPAD